MIYLQIICIIQFSDDADKVLKGIATVFYLMAIFSKLILTVVNKEKVQFTRKNIFIYYQSLFSTLY